MTEQLFPSGPLNMPMHRNNLMPLNSILLAPQAPPHAQGSQTQAPNPQHFPQPPQPRLLVVSNCPRDLTRREATLIFLLVADDVVLVDVKDGNVVAAFKLPLTCVTTGKLLDGKQIFGTDYAPVQVECDPQPPVAQFGNMRLDPKILPPTLAQPVGPNKLSSRLRFVFSDPFSGLAPTHLDLLELGQQQPLMFDQLAPLLDPWGPVNLAPRTPAVSTPFDWGQQNGSQNGQDRRRTLLAFFNNHPPQLGQHQHFQGLGQAQTPPGQGLSPQNPPQQNQGQNQPQPPSQAFAGSQPAPPPQPQQPPTMAAAVANPPPPKEPLPQPLPPEQAREPKKDVPDLLLLARVPPPANPADQNPPCNTLYVGNLPPDAIEAELRTLFSPQKGFRRLLFRTKNSLLLGSGLGLSHNHGPMCFVEFEDVAHATRALAELYGRALPRPNGGNSKGGIRLSFSKNPLGVRGPGNPRRTLANPAPLSLLTPQNGGVGNYGYLHYHVK